MRPNVTPRRGETIEVALSDEVLGLIFLSEEEVAQLSTTGVKADRDLSFLTREDIARALDASTVVTRGRILDVCQYLRAGHIIDAGTTMSDITKAVMFPAANVAFESGSVYAASTAAATVTPIDDAKQAPRVSVDKISAFCGAPLKWENWSVKTSSQLGQTHYEPLLVGPAPENDARLRKRDKELYYMLQYALFEGTANHIVESAKDSKSGHTVWAALETWYGR